MTEITEPMFDPQDVEEVVPSDLRFPVVGIGASAGGLSALQKFFEHLPADSGMAFVVILHLSPKHKSGAAEILQRSTRMPVQQVLKPVPIQANQVYVIPPSKALQMSDGYLRVTPMKRPQGRHVAIDLFFRTLAEVHRQHAFAIVLSGTGADGAVGITRIKEQGGVTLAQTPADAEYESMPQSCIATGMVDIVLPVVEMPEKLIFLWRNARNIRLPESDDVVTPLQPPESGLAAQGAENALRDIMVSLRSSTGHDFRHYKRATVLRRIERRLQVNALPDLPAYRDFLASQPSETTALLKDMLISVTNFFRDREAFDVLEREAIVPMFVGREADDPVRVWSAGCATGEEAYSLSIMLAEQAAPMMRPPALEVFASDIDEAAIAVARAGLYPESIVTDVTPERLREFFMQEQNRYRVKKAVREKVLFARHNLLRDPPFSRLDLISCRNLLIYLARDVQSEILQMFHFALRPGGYLFLGSSESADVASKWFSVIDKKNRLYRANAVSRISRPLPTMPLGAAEKKAATSVEPPNQPACTLSFADLHQRALEQHAPPSVLIDRDYNIVHLSDRAGRFLRYVGGAPSNDLMRLVHPELRQELRTALFQSAQSGSSVEARRVKMAQDNRYINMLVRPLPDTGAGAGYTLVLFDEVEQITGADGVPADPSKDHIVLQFEEELQRSKEQLQGIIEQSEAATEELKASNEELQASNEELRSATEELETSREELQSVNEELITVNYELKVKVEETTKANDDLQNLIASADIATIFIDSAMRIQRYTPRALDLFNVIASDLGRLLTDITHRLGYPDLAADAATVFASLRPIEREVRSGKRWYIGRILPYRTAEDRIVGAVLTFIDITRLKQAEERLRSSEEQMRLVAENTRDYAIFTLDNDGLITNWNRGAERMFGYTEAELLGQPATLLFLPEDRDRGALEYELMMAREKGRYENELWALRKDGSRFFYGVVTTSLGGGRETARGFAKIGRDLTRDKRIEAERETMLASEQSARAEAVAAIARKDEFLAVMSHELKHPLNLIHVNAELLARLPESRDIAPVARAAETIRRAVTGQAQIIDDMLDLSRMQTGKLVLSPQAFDWKAAVESIVGAVEADAAAKSLTVTLTADSQAFEIFADIIRAEQMVWNLVSNALKFTRPAGRVELRLTQEAGFGRLDVSDTGIGIRPELLEKVFEMFSQGDSTTTRKQGGLGIGLALVRQLADLHGGRVQAFSTGLGQGSRFSLWLPLAEMASTAEDQGPVDIESLLADKQVLLVDDSVDALEVFAELLKLIGVKVTTANNGAHALSRIAEQDFDLILSDVGMPGMDGYQLIQAVRSGSRNQATQAIAITGCGRQNDIDQALAAGFTAHLCKPITIEGLKAVLLKSLTLSAKTSD